MNKLLLRLLLIITVPISLVILVLYVMCGAIPYYIFTGKDISKTLFFNGIEELNYMLYEQTKS